MTRVLLIDDDVDLSSMLQEYLEREGFEVATAEDGESGAAEAASGKYSIVVLDVMLPRLNGVEVLRRIRLRSRVPVLMLTAKGDDIDRVVGLELGADDYVPKPCTPRELLARLRAILRRTEGATAGDEGPLSFGPLTLWPSRRQAEWEGNPLSLTSTEFNLLLALTQSAGRVVSRAELSEKGLGRRLARYDRSVDVHISSLRQKIGKLQDDRSYIQTIRGHGYQLIKE